MGVNNSVNGLVPAMGARRRSRAHGSDLGHRAAPMVRGNTQATTGFAAQPISVMFFTWGSPFAQPGPTTSAVTLGGFGPASRIRTALRPS